MQKIELDCAYNDNHKIEIDSIFYSDAVSVKQKKLPFQQSKDKLTIEIGERLSEGSKFYLIIKYFANGTKPPDGFIFIESNNNVAYQAWTQGEAIASKKWFPCIDHPQVKFPREIIAGILIIELDGQLGSLILCTAKKLHFFFIVSSVSKLI